MPPARRRTPSATLGAFIAHRACSIVRRSKVCDPADLAAEEKIRFTSSILPKWARRTKSLDALLPILYLRGVSTGDFQEALAALLGKDAPNLSPASRVVSRSFKQPL
jgi:putative transposase